jgi:hypothetical protein
VLAKIAQPPITIIVRPGGPLGGIAGFFGLGLAAERAEYLVWSIDRGVASEVRPEHRRLPFS